MTAFTCPLSCPLRTRPTRNPTVGRLRHAAAHTPGFQRGGITCLCGFCIHLCKYQNMVLTTRCRPTSRGLQTLLQVTSGPTPSATMLPGSRRLWHAGSSKPLPPRKARKGFGFDVGFGFGFGFTAPPPHPGPFTRTRHAWRRPHVLPRRSRVCVRGARLCQGHPAGD